MHHQKKLSFSELVLNDSPIQYVKNSCINFKCNLLAKSLSQLYYHN